MLRSPFLKANSSSTAGSAHSAASLRSLTDFAARGVQRCHKALATNGAAQDKKRRTSLASDQATTGDARQSLLMSALMALPVIGKRQRRRSEAVTRSEGEARELRKRRARQSLGLDPTFQSELSGLSIYLTMANDESGSN